MPCPHNKITIVQRSQRQSAVAAAAYQSGEKLFCEYDQQVNVQRGLGMLPWLIERVTVHDDRIEVEFKSSIAIDIEN